MSRWLSFALVALALSAACAAPASPHGSIYNQPDGSETPELFMKGNQHYNWIADRKGYTVIRDPRGWWCYATKVNGELVSSGVRVGYGNPKKLGLMPELSTDPDKHPIDYLLTHDGVAKDHCNLLTVPSLALCGFEGTKDKPCHLKSLFLLIHFSDHDKRILPDPEVMISFLIIMVQQQTALCQVVGHFELDVTNACFLTYLLLIPLCFFFKLLGSVADVFMANSYDTFVLESHVMDWINVTYTEEQTVGGRNGLNTYVTRTMWNQDMWMYGA